MKRANLAMISFLDKSNTIAPEGYNRWCVPPAALAIHLCIGQIYAYSVFNKPLSQALGITGPVEGDWSLDRSGTFFPSPFFVWVLLRLCLADGWKGSAHEKPCLYLPCVFQAAFFFRRLGFGRIKYGCCISETAC